MAVQPSLCQNCSESLKTGFLATQHSPAQLEIHHSFYSGAGAADKIIMPVTRFSAFDICQKERPSPVCTFAQFDQGCSNETYNSSKEGTFELDHPPLEVILIIESPITKVFFHVS